jgi:hypothetical protein
VTEADFIIIGIAIAVVGVVLVGVIGCAPHGKRHASQPARQPVPPFGLRNKRYS